MLPTINRCEARHKSESEHDGAQYEFKRDRRYPEWHGWHAARRGLGGNLYRLGVAEMVIQRILRHTNVSTTATYYIETAADDVRRAMTRLENSILTTEREAQTQERNRTPMGHQGVRRPHLTRRSSSW